MKEKINRDKVISLYINGSIANEIAEILSYHVITVRKTIKNYKDYIGEEKSEKVDRIHREYRNERFGDIITFKKKQMRKYMSTRTVVNSSQNGYKLNKRKTALIYKSTVGAKPCDLPSVYR